MSQRMTTLVIHGTDSKDDYGGKQEHSGSEGVVYESYIGDKWLIGGVIVYVL